MGTLTEGITRKELSYYICGSDLRPYIVERESAKSLDLKLNVEC